MSRAGKSEALMLRESIDELRHTLLTSQQPAEEALLTRDQVCGLLACGKDFFYAHIEPHLHRVNPGGLVRYTRASYSEFVRRNTTTAAGEPVHPEPKRAARRRSGVATNDTNATNQEAA